MKKFAIIAAITLLAPATAFAQDCGTGMAWSSAQQTCVPIREATAEFVQDSGQGWWIQPVTDAAAELIRDTAPSCEGCVMQR
jgi:hypothetical protein